MSSQTAKSIQYELPDVKGEMQKLDQYQGKWLIVNYWATWCRSCLKEIPHLSAIHNKAESNIAVIGINYETINPEKLNAFIESYEIPYPVWLSKEVATTPLGNVPALPTTFIIDPHGDVVAGQVGVIDQSALEKYIQQASSDSKYQ